MKEDHNEKRVFVVDIDHTLLNLTSLMSFKVGVSPDKFISPIMEVDGVDYQKILNAWNCVDSVYQDIIKAVQSYTFYEFRNYRMPLYFNEDVFNLLENNLVVFVSSSFTRNGTFLKSDIVDLYRKRFNSYTEDYVPTDLITFADRNYEEHSYKNVLQRLHLLGYQVVCVDDNPTRLEWANELNCQTLLVPQVWNKGETRFQRLGIGYEN